ncbi:MAG: DNA mismatch repair protein MutS [Firmicutes bacterium]|nr:DNA mismatch repair protein MutS [Bacillota bacterium]
MKDIESTYHTLLNGNKQRLKKERKRDNSFVIIRGIFFLGIVAFMIIGYLQELAFLYLYLLPLILIFLILIKKHYRIRNDITYLQNLITINTKGLQRLSGHWVNFSNKGERFIDSDHPYTSDLNIFGHGSLYQYLNATTFYLGEQELASLLSEESNVREIKLRQEAVKDLAARFDWRQGFEATGMNTDKKNHIIKVLLAWVDEKRIIKNTNNLYILWLVPIITAVMLILMAFGYVPSYLPLIFIMLQFFILIIIQTKTFKVLKGTENASCILDQFAETLKMIEQETLQAPLLKDIQRRLYVNGKTASQQVKSLSKITGLLSFRYYILYWVFNALTFSDLYTIIKLNKWKSKSGKYLNDWLKVIAQLEALSSLAILAHDNPNWVFPEVSDDKPYFKATSLGHPLIKKEDRVANDVHLSSTGTILVITGSNMSGKSTLLRTVGINLTLAYAGAPVCARSINCPLMNIYTSMRIQDSLEQNISAFYAELNRIKLIIEAAKNGKPLIFMIDEIFKGTNSQDRILGAKTIIKNLTEYNAIGFVTTHDLELSILEKEFPDKIKNYNFNDEIINNEITFNYKLEKGVSKTTNAIALMKMVGIIE